MHGEFGESLKTTGRRFVYIHGHPRWVLFLFSAQFIPIDFVGLRRRGIAREIDKRAHWFVYHGERTGDEVDAHDQWHRVQPKESK